MLYSLHLFLYSIGCEFIWRGEWNLLYSSCLVAVGYSIIIAKWMTTFLRLLISEVEAEDRVINGMKITKFVNLWNILCLLKLPQHFLSLMPLNYNILWRFWNVHLLGEERKIQLLPWFLYSKLHEHETEIMLPFQNFSRVTFNTTWWSITFLYLP